MSAGANSIRQPFKENEGERGRRSTAPIAMQQAHQARTRLKRGIRQPLRSSQCQLRGGIQDGVQSMSPASRLSMAVA